MAQAAGYVVVEYPEVLKTVPHFTPIDKVDETAANRDLCLSELLTEDLPGVLGNRMDQEQLSRMSTADIIAKIIEAHNEQKHS